jgi:cytochrome c peroxidase
MRVLTVFQTLAFSCAALSTIAQNPNGNPHSGEAFFKVDFPNVHSNGRSCATCHVPEDAFQLSPQHVEERYQALLERRLTNPLADDPLFRAIDANDFAEDFTNLRSHALVRVGIQLPIDANGNKLVWPVNDPNATFVSVWRSIPTVMNTAFTAPYQLDGRQPTLQAQALGALVGHGEITREPLLRFLNDVAAFETAQFSSPAVKLLSDALGSGQIPPPTDPPLMLQEQLGKTLFAKHCTNCHGGPTQTVPLPTLPPAIHNIRISKPVPPVGANMPGTPTAPLPFAPSPLQPRLWAFRIPGQAIPEIRSSTDPGQALLTGNIAHLNFFDIPTLHGISKTAPYFHDNSAATLEDVVRHYQTDAIFVRSVAAPGAPRPELILDEEIAPLVAYLKKI